MTRRFPQRLVAKCTTSRAGSKPVTFLTRPHYDLKSGNLAVRSRSDRSLTRPWQAKSCCGRPDDAVAESLLRDLTMREIKGPAIFLAQFLSEQAPFNSLRSIA